MRNTKIILPLFLLVLLIPIASIAQETVWQKHTFSQGKFSINFPSDIEEEEEAKEYGTLFKIKSSVGDMKFMATFTVHNSLSADEDRKELANTSLKAFVGTTGGTVASEKTWKVKKHLGIDAIIDLTSVNAKVAYKVIIIGNIQYQIITLAENDKYDEKLAKKFLKSFKLMK